MHRYAVVFYRAEDKEKVIVGISCPERKKVVPYAFTLEAALDYITTKTGNSISRGRDTVTIYHLKGEELGKVHSTYTLAWQRVNNNHLSQRHL